MAAAAEVAIVQPSQVKITPPNFVQAVIEIRGTAPYVQNKFSQKARKKMEAVHAAGSQAKSKRVREPRNPQADYEAATYRTKEGWYGMPAPNIRNGCISACRIVGFKMTHAKLSLFVIPDGYDREDNTPLVRIYGEPKMHTATVRNDDGSCDIRYRPMFAQWSAKVRIRWDADQFSATDIVNLLSRVGQQVGIGEGRADSKNSAGLGWGHFEVVR